VETQRISTQLRQAFDGNAWHGPSVSEILRDVTCEIATARPIPGVHSIWEIVMHLIAIQRIILRRLDGDSTAINVPQPEEWPAVTEESEAAWQKTLLELHAGDCLLRTRIENFPDDRLDEPLLSGGSTAYNNFHGYVQHNLYHAAQIGLLKKLQSP
jgi:uncharacterized damage-inducible protein DinB